MPFILNLIDNGTLLGVHIANCWDVADKWQEFIGSLYVGMNRETLSLL
jgi:hypothetical protein